MGRTPPNNPEAERSLVGSVLLSAGLIDKINLDPKCFYNPSLRAIWRHCKHLAEQASPVDLVTVSHSLNAAGELDRIGGPVFLSGLTDMVPSPSKGEHYAKIVKDLAKTRELIQVASTVVDMGHLNFTDHNELREDLEQAVFSFSEKEQVSGYISAGDIADRYIEKIKKVSAKPGSVCGLETGFIDLDKMTLGLQPSDLIILAGRPSMGKTALAMNITRSISILRDVPTGVFSLEMSKDQLMMRLLSSLTGIGSRQFQMGTIARNEWGKINAVREKIKDSPLFIDDTPALSISEIRSRGRRMKREHGIKFIMVDYLQLARAKAEKREREISSISSELKAMAKELDIPVLALSQLNRSLESRTDKRPILSDLRESGAIEQDADVICFLYRDEVYNRQADNPNKGLAELAIGKQRNGPTGTVMLQWDDKTTTFKNAVL